MRLRVEVIAWVPEVELGLKGVLILGRAAKMHGLHFTVSAQATHL